MVMRIYEDDVRIKRVPIRGVCRPMLMRGLESLAGLSSLAIAFTGEKRRVPV